ncbi:MAG: hypothetical protein LBU61_01480 [Coriobacteriales bacterium]|nr:hypothetical protein [Coriobacteriales bacterium]
MQKSRKKVLSVLLAGLVAMTMFIALPTTAMAAPPDLTFTVEPGSAVPLRTITNVDNPIGDLGNYYIITSSPDGSTYNLGANVGPTGADRPEYIIGSDINVISAIGSFTTLYEVSAAGIVLNYGSVQLTNDLLCAPTPGTTTIVSGAGQATISNYQYVQYCSLYLVPESLYPTGGGLIDLGNAAVLTITANGDITGLPAGKYTLYTVWTSSLTLPQHSAYFAGTEITVTAALPNVCAIDTTEFPTLGNALAVVDDGETIRLIDDILLTSSVFIDNGKQFTIDTNGFTLDFDYNSLTVDESDVTFNGVSNFENLLWIDMINCKVVYNGNLVLTDGFFAVIEGSEATLNGNLTCLSDDGVGASKGSKVTVNGDISATDVGVIARYPETTVFVAGNVEGYDGVVCLEGATVNINGNVKATGGEGVGVYSDGYSVPDDTIVYLLTQVFVSGNVVSEGDDGWGVEAYDNGQITVDGTITAAGTFMIVNGDTVTKNPTSLKSGYSQYSDDPDGELLTITAIWLKINTTPPVTPPVSPPTGDLSTMVSLLILMLTLIAGTFSTLLYRKQRQFI